MARTYFQTVAAHNVKMGHAEASNGKDKEE